MSNRVAPRRHSFGASVTCSADMFRKQAGGFTPPERSPVLQRGGVYPRRLQRGIKKSQSKPVPFTAGVILQTPGMNAGASWQTSVQPKLLAHTTANVYNYRMKKPIAISQKPIGTGFRLLPVACFMWAQLNAYCVSGFVMTSQLPEQLWAPT